MEKSEAQCSELRPPALSRDFLAAGARLSNPGNYVLPPISSGSFGARWAGAHGKRARQVHTRHGSTLSLSFRQLQDKELYDETLPYHLFFLAVCEMVVFSSSLPLLLLLSFASRVHQAAPCFPRSSEIPVPPKSEQEHAQWGLPLPILTPILRVLRTRHDAMEDINWISIGGLAIDPTFLAQFVRSGVLYGGDQIA